MWSSETTYKPSILKMKAAGCSETLVTFYLLDHSLYIPVERNFYIQNSINLISLKILWIQVTVD
jgi:hypothetical protein